MKVEDGREGEEENENFMDSLNEVKDSGKAFDVRSSPPEEEVNWFTTAQQQAKMLMVCSHSLPLYGFVYSVCTGILQLFLNFLEQLCNQKNSSF